MAGTVEVRGEAGARERAQLMDWGVVVEEEMGGEVVAYLIGQDPAETPALLRTVADAIEAATDVPERS